METFLPEHVLIMH